MAASDLVFSQSPLTDGHLVFGDDSEVVQSTQISDLVFSQPPLTDGHLVFGDDSEVVQSTPISVSATLPGLSLSALLAPDVLVDVAATLPGPSLVATVAPVYHVSVAATLPGPSLAAAAHYDVYVPMRMLTSAASPFQQAQPTPHGVEAVHQDGQRLRPATSAHHSEAQRLAADTFVPLQNADRLHNAVSTKHANADDVRAATRERHANALRLGRAGKRTRYAVAVDLRAARSHRHANMLRLGRRGLRVHHQDAADVRKPLWSTFDTALPWHDWLCEPYQEAMRPPPGVWNPTPPLPPPEEPCYTPDPDLVFKDVVAADGHLLFICEKSGPGPVPEPIIVPVRRAYIVINEAYLRRVDTNTLIPATSLSLSIDADSWTWSFNAAVDPSARSLVEPANYGDQIELEIVINDSPYRVLVEKVQMSREFPRRQLSLSGRGKSAVLADPFSPHIVRSNETMRTAQQLMNDALTENGVSIGWTLDWRITDWVVPAGAWSFAGTYMEAVTAIAASVGAYILPHPTQQVLRVMPRYPVKPWEFDAATPDLILPANVVRTESEELIDYPAYNGIYVRGEGQGVQALVKRTGTAGDFLMQMVTDKLITHADAARQRGIAALGESGRVRKVSIALPVLPETGIIEPGTMIRYHENGVNRMGLVRSTSVDVAHPAIMQSLEIETRG